MTAPTLTTPRLTLRPPRAADLDASLVFWASDRTRFMGGPLDAAAARSEWDEVSLQWARHGFGMFVLTRHGDDAPIGLAGPYYPETHPEPELGWNLWNAADEGLGLAGEAVVAARDWFFAATPHRTAVSYTHPDNTRSHRLAEAAGAVRDPDAPCPYPPPVVIWRHRAGGSA